MAKINKFLVKLPVNKLMWDKLAVKSNSDEYPSAVQYAGDTSPLVNKITWQGYNTVMAYVSLMRYSSAYYAVYDLIEEIVYDKS